MTAASDHGNTLQPTVNTRLITQHNNVRPILLFRPFQGHNVAPRSQQPQPTAPPLEPVFVRLAVPPVPPRSPAPITGPASGGFVSPGGDVPGSPTPFATPPGKPNSPPGLSPSPPGGRRSPQQVRVQPMGCRTGSGVMAQCCSSRCLSFIICPPADLPHGFHVRLRC